MKATREQKNQAIQQLKRSFDKESHASALVSGILRTCNNEEELASMVGKAKSVVESVRARGVSSFFAAEYGKLFQDPQTAMATRERLMAIFEINHSLPPKRAAKMADCIVFTCAKKGGPEYIERFALLSAKALRAVVPFEVLADVVYYSAADIDPAAFAKRCVATSLKKNKPLVVSEVELAARLNN